MSALVDSNPAYQSVKLIRVEWDSFREAPITSELGVKRRSTLVMFDDGVEVGRVVSQTGIAAIEALFKAAT